MLILRTIVNRLPAASSQATQQNLNIVYRKGLVLFRLFQSMLEMALRYVQEGWVCPPKHSLI